MSALNASELEKQWQTEARWNGIQRPYSGNDVAEAAGLDPGRTHAGAAGRGAALVAAAS